MYLQGFVLFCFCYFRVTPLDWKKPHDVDGLVNA